MGFSKIKQVSLKKTTLSADKVGFLRETYFTREKPILSARVNKVRLSVHADKDCFPNGPTLKITWVFSGKTTLSEKNRLSNQIM